MGNLINLENQTTTSSHAIKFCEQNKLLKYIDNEKYHFFFYFCCCTGVRACEALNIKFKDIDFKNNIIKITLKDTKTKKHKRDIPFCHCLFDNIKLKKRGFLFADITDEASKKYFMRFYKTHKMELNRHSTRHTFISICNYLKIDHNIVMQWVGHTDVKMTDEVYTHKLRKGTSAILDYLIILKQQQKI